MSFLTIIMLITSSVSTPVTAQSATFWQNQMCFLLHHVMCQVCNKTPKALRLSACGFFLIYYLFNKTTSFLFLRFKNWLPRGRHLDLYLGAEVNGMAFRGPAYLQLSELIKGRCSSWQVWQKQVGDAGRPAPLKHWQLIQMPKDGVRQLNLGTQAGKVLAL